LSPSNLKAGFKTCSVHHVNRKAVNLVPANQKLSYTKGSEKENSKNSNITRSKDPTKYGEITSEEADDDKIVTRKSSVTV